jgi:hypothetical protein
MKRKIDEVSIILSQREKILSKLRDETDKCDEKCNKIIDKDRTVGDTLLSFKFGFACAPVSRNPMIAIFKQDTKENRYGHIDLSFEEGQALYEMLKELYGGEK